MFDGVEFRRAESVDDGNILQVLEPADFTAMMNQILRLRSTHARQRHQLLGRSRIDVDLINLVDVGSRVIDRRLADGREIQHVIH